MNTASHRRPSSQSLWLRSSLAAGLLALTVSAASAQPGGTYTGPTNVPQSTVKALLDTGRDDQKAVLRGRIVSHEGGEDYMFDDGTGRILVEIDRDIFPRNIDANTVVELIGEFERENNKVEFDVDLIRIP